MSQVVENELQVGDLVRVIDADSALHGLEGYIAKTDFGAPPNVYLFESDNKQHRGWLAVGSLRKLRDSWVPKPPTDHIADANKMVSSAIPAGCREPGIVAEKNWKPKIGDWVRIKMCDTDSCHGGCWVTGMEYLDGQIRRVEELITDGSGIVVDCFWLCDRCIEPWEPRPGEKVQVIKVNRVYEVRSFDKTRKMVSCVDRSRSIELEFLKPYIEQPAKEPEAIVCYHRVCELAIDEPTPESQGHPDHVEGVWVDLQLISIANLMDFSIANLMDLTHTSASTKPLRVVANSRVKWISDESSRET